MEKENTVVDSANTATNEKTELATPQKSENNFPAILKKELQKNKDAMPKDFNLERFWSNTMAMITDPKTPQLVTKDNYREVVKCLLEGAKCDLEYKKDFYVLPFKSKVDNLMHLEMQFDYKGLLKLIKRYSEMEIKKVIVNNVYEGDIFEVDALADKPIIHKPQFKTREDDKIEKAYVYIEYINGGCDYEIMTREDLNRVMNCTKCKDKQGKIYGVWKDWYPEMTKKSCIRRISKRITLNFENSNVNQIWNREQEIEYDLNQPKEKHEVVSIAEVKNV